jgi:hypothetical protein
MNDAVSALASSVGGKTRRKAAVTAGNIARVATATHSAWRRRGSGER